jgi:hypothetical protein
VVEGEGGGGLALGEVEGGLGEGGEPFIGVAEDERGLEAGEDLGADGLGGEEGAVEFGEGARLVAEVAEDVELGGGAGPVFGEAEGLEEEDAELGVGGEVADGELGGGEGGGEVAGADGLFGFGLGLGHGG